MPSTPQSVPTIQVYDYAMRSGDPALTLAPTVPTGTKVTVTLAYKLGRSTAPVTWITAQTVYATTTDGNGYWTVFVVPNNKINPANTYYVVEVEGYLSYQIQVTDIGVPAGGWQSSAAGILLNVPAALAPTTSTVGAITATGLITAQAGINITAGGLTVAGGETETGGLTVDTLSFSQSVSRIQPGNTSISLRNNANNADNLIVTDAGNATLRGTLTVMANVTFQGTVLSVPANFNLQSAGDLFLQATAGNIYLRPTAQNQNNALQGTAGIWRTYDSGGSVRNVLDDGTGKMTVAAGLTVTAGTFTFGAAASQIVPGATSLAFQNNANNATNLLLPDNGQAVLRNGLALLGGIVDVPAGTLGFSGLITATQGPYTALTDLTNLSVTVTVGTGRRIRIEACAPQSSSVSTDIISLFIREGATTLQQSEYINSFVGGSAGGYPISVILSPGAGAHTYKLSGQRIGGTGNITMLASAVAPAYILVQDIGT